MDEPVDREDASTYRDGVQPRYLKLSDVAERLSMTTRQVYSLVRSGELQGIQVGGRNQWRVPEDAVEEYIARHDDDGDEPLMGALV